jgi:hypothetical protein
VPAPEFVAFHVAGVVVTETITAFLLFGQFRQSRTPSLLVLAAAYLFTAPITLAHLLAFPSINPGQGRLIGGPHSSAWLWLLWHGGFALLVLAYVLVDWRWQGRQIGRGVAGRAITTTCAAVLLAVLGMTVLATRGSFLLPPLAWSSARSSSRRRLFSASGSSIAAGPSSISGSRRRWRRRPAISSSPCSARRASPSAGSAGGSSG